MSLSDDLAWRGLIKDTTFKNKRWLDEPRTFYWGVDCSSDSLTIGNLAPLLLARRLAEAGWKAVLLVGGATSLIGDPGGKDAERPLLPRETVQKNAEAIKKQVAGIFAGQKFTPADNYDWFKDVGYLEFLREVGKHFSVTELLQRDFISERIGEDGSGISYAEFSYSLIQGYDFWQLYKKYTAELQIGGSDQWGNMISGVGLIRKKENAETHALSMPLVVNKATGRKFGKSEAGAVWLDPRQTTPTQFYQFWMNADDADAEDYLKIFTLLERPKIEAIIKAHNAHPEKRHAQTELARELTDLVHGKAAREFAEQVTMYLTGELPVTEASDSAVEEIKKALAHTSVQPGTPVLEVIVAAGLAASKSEARRLQQSGAVYVDNQTLSRDHLEAADFKNGRLMLRRGKAYKDSALIELK
jgi:tyrosyl-tRNA synthetase